MYCSVVELKEQVNEDKTEHSNVFPEAVALFIDVALNVHQLCKNFTEWNKLFACRDRTKLDQSLCRSRKEEGESLSHSW